MSTQDWKSHAPLTWAKEKEGEGLKRFEKADLGPEFIRQSGIIFPDVPAELLMGFALNAKANENTTGFITGLSDERPPKLAKPPLGGVTSQSFHELGMFGVEGGNRNAPAPAPGSPWSLVAVSKDVEALLGRVGKTNPGGWTSIPDQIAVGLVNTRNHGRTVTKQLPEKLKSSTENSFWFVTLSFMGWSAGDGGTVKHLRLFQNDLASVTESARWGTFLRLLASVGEKGKTKVESGTKIHHRSPFWSAMRTLQKIEAGMRLCDARKKDTAFFDDGLGPNRSEIHETITRCAVYGTPLPE